MNMTNKNIEKATALLASLGFKVSSITPVSQLHDAKAKLNGHTHEANQAEKKRKIGRMRGLFEHQGEVPMPKSSVLELLIDAGYEKPEAEKAELTEQDELLIDMVENVTGVNIKQCEDGFAFHCSSDNSFQVMRMYEESIDEVPDTQSKCITGICADILKCHSLINE